MWISARAWWRTAKTNSAALVPEWRGTVKGRRGVAWDHGDSSQLYEKHVAEMEADEVNVDNTTHCWKSVERTSAWQRYHWARWDIAGLLGKTAPRKTTVRPGQIAVEWKAWGYHTDITRKSRERRWRSEWARWGLASPGRQARGFGGSREWEANRRAGYWPPQLWIKCWAQQAAGLCSA